ncbi:hypothetical protein CFE70_008503 [Pyrenophora teres f. teres 0-1]|uniref:DUF6594 domain-containing protein n=2 Tax=Pyrenophora teres f. teres TaxID=97479 RepID=E3RR30_PYRTT|nr:hypothetical protein PTT_11239 [Pyrenophora teres f. teres 0-1]CAE7202766.1 hypothetical protein PTTW11_09096 [Pyrenophora teres f. teres]
MANIFRARDPVLPAPVTSPGANIPSTLSPSVPMRALTSAGTTLSNASLTDKEKFGKAWKYEGYKEFGRWMASDDDFFVFRRFESLNATTIAYLQYRISQLESKLEGIHHANEQEKDRKNSSFKWDEQYQQDRFHIMGELSRLLLHYNQYIDAFSKIRKRPRAEPRQIKSMENWLERGAITASEKDFVKHKSDLISINERVRPPLGRWLEACRILHTWRIFKAKFREDLHVRSDATSYSSDETFESFTSLGIIILGLAMLLAPLWWLERVKDSQDRLKIITGFVTLFISLMTGATINRPFEVVASTAAYAAVLMVFMQIGGS